jgi:hypothetical protein
MTAAEGEEEEVVGVPDRLKGSCKRCPDKGRDEAVRGVIELTGSRTAFI